MSVHWSDWVGLGLMIGIAIFMTGWYLKENVARRRGQQPSGPDATDFTA